MRRRLAWAVVGLCWIVLIQIDNFGAYHDGRCGAQKWERWILWLDLGEPDYDEFGIARRWTLAHAVACRPIWMAGPLQANDGSGYWPALHLAIAQGQEMDRIEALIGSDPDAVTRRDRLGRTPMHWAAIYPDRAKRATLERILLRAGASDAEKDLDGLTPGDWQARYDSAS